jgi:hypothetical protein
MKIIHTVLQSDIFTAQPPVLIDIGASGEINTKWKIISPYSICLAFDADDREFHVSEKTNTQYKKLISFNRIVTSDAQNEYADFFLTASPFCSSLLEPDPEKLSCWVFKDLFKVDKVAKLPVTTLQNALEQAGINYIDWFKADTQGTDLRLLTTLPQSVQSNILAAELEPGILDAYKGEDKLYSVMQHMHNNNYWLSNIKVQGTQRLNNSYLDIAGSFAGKRAIRRSPGWAEVTYLRQPSVHSERQLLLLFVFALLEKQYGFALEITDVALQQYPDTIFGRCKEEVLRKIRSEKLKAPLVIAKRQFNKLFSAIND